MLARHGRLRAANDLQLTEVPTLCVAGLSAAQRRALMLADNKIAENAGWDRDLLAVELGELTGLLDAYVYLSLGSIDCNWPVCMSS